MLFSRSLDCLSNSNGNSDSAIYWGLMLQEGLPSLLDIHHVIYALQKPYTV